MITIIIDELRTHIIGKEVLKKNWKSVVEMIISQVDFDERVNNVKQYLIYLFNVREFLKNHDCRAALKNLPNKNVSGCRFFISLKKIERILIEGL
jgi:tRNA(Glu) U13 pseudouridine synthase TruD